MRDDTSQDRPPQDDNEPQNESQDIQTPTSVDSPSVNTTTMRDDLAEQPDAAPDTVTPDIADTPAILDETVDGLPDAPTVPLARPTQSDAPSDSDATNGDASEADISSVAENEPAG